WTTTPRWRPARDWLPRAPGRLAACSPTNTRTCGRWPSELSVGEKGDVRAAGWRQRAVKQRDDQLPAIRGGTAGPQRGVGPAQHLGIDGARTDADGADAMLFTLHSDRLGEADDAVLGDVVRGQPGKLLGGVDAGERGNVDDPPFTGR